MKIDCRFTRLVLCIILTFLIISCSQKKFRNTQISKIEIATGECYRNCSQIAIGIDSSLALKYYGGRNAKLKGYYSGNITLQLWDTLTMKLEAIRYKRLSLQNDLLDDQEIELIIHDRNKTVHIETTITYPPDSIKKVFEWLINSYKLVNLEPVNDSVKFETTYQYQQPPHPKLKQVHFPRLLKID